MTENCVVKIEIEDISREVFEELIDKTWGIWGKPDKSYANTLLFTSTDDYRVQLTYIEKQKSYTLIIHPKKCSGFLSMEEVENTLNSFLNVVICEFNKKYKTNVHTCVEDL